MRSVFFILMLETCVFGPATANVILVPSVHPTIQAGINAAATGDTVLVDPGTYTGTSNRNLDFAGKNIVLRSSAGSATTIIDCQSLARGMRFHTGETVASVVQGFTIRNGLASGAFGGGILVENNARPIIRDCRFQTNHANTGGGIFVSSAVTMTDCVFEDNLADNYGGGAYGETANLQATRCSFTQNRAGIGAGVSVHFGAAATLTDCSFTENEPANLGGGLYSSASTVALRRCTFIRNTGKNGAGGYLLDGTASVDSCSFRMNTANYGGGGLQSEQVEPLSVAGCVFEGNITLTTNPLFHSGGGGLQVRDAPPSLGSEVSDCVFTGNQAFGSDEAVGGGIYAFSTTTLIQRCTFIDNHAEKTGGGANCRRVHDSVFQGNTSFNGGGVFGAFEILGCHFTDNHALNFGGGCYPFGEVIAEGCVFSGNSAGFRGGGLYSVHSNAGAEIANCQFIDNYSSNGGGAFIYVGEPSSITGCTFVGNSASLGGAMHLQGISPPPSVDISACTIVANAAQTAGGVNLTMPVEIANTIIAFGTQGEAVACSGDGVGVMSCTDIFSNVGGDWTACIADQVGINGNFSLDPRFCNVGGRDFTLAQSSPCTAANAPAGCGLIGAYPAACATPIGIADAGASSLTPVLRVMPNPVRGSGSVEWSGVVGAKKELRLYDVAGRLVARRAGEATSGSVAWSTLIGTVDVTSGVYFLEVGDEHTTSSRVRVVVIR